MANTTQDAERDDRIMMEIVVDCYDKSEQMTGWHCYLGDNLQFPFTAVCTNKRSISPIHQGGKVEVVGMSSADEWEREMFVEIVWDCDTLAVALSQLTAPDADAKTQEAIADWHYWVA